MNNGVEYIPIITLIMVGMIKLDPFLRKGVELHPDKICSQNMWIFLLWKHGWLNIIE